MRDLKDHFVGLDADFRYRGSNQTRIETFSDAVFAFAFTLVVLSSSVPENFQELRASLREIIPFMISVVLIVVIWYQHYIFFLRYGLQDSKTVVINTLLLFMLLIYVYPLKFLSTFLFELYAGLFSGDMARFTSLYAADLDMGLLMNAYGTGATLIFLTMAWLYHHALKRKEALALNTAEVFATKVSRVQNLLMASVPAFCTIISVFKLFGDTTTTYIVAGFSYMLYFPVMFIFAARVRKNRAKLSTDEA